MQPTTSFCATARVSPAQSISLGFNTVFGLYEFDGGKSFSLAGLSETWKDPASANADPQETFTLVTTDANELTRRFTIECR